MTNLLEVIVTVELLINRLNEAKLSSFENKNIYFLIGYTTLPLCIVLVYMNVLVTIFVLMRKGDKCVSSLHS